MGKSSVPSPKVDLTQHGDQQPVEVPPTQIVREAMAAEAGAFDVLHPTPTPGFTPPRRATGGKL